MLLLSLFIYVLCFYFIYFIYFPPPSPPPPPPPPPLPCPPAGAWRSSSAAPQRKRRCVARSTTAEILASSSSFLLVYITLKPGGACASDHHLPAGGGQGSTVEGSSQRDPKQVSLGERLNRSPARHGSAAAPAGIPPTRVASPTRQASTLLRSYPSKPRTSGPSTPNRAKWGYSAGAWLRAGRGLARKAFQVTREGHLKVEGHARFPRAGTLRRLTRKRRNRQRYPHNTAALTTPLTPP